MGVLDMQIVAALKQLPVLLELFNTSLYAF